MTVSIESITQLTVNLCETHPQTLTLTFVSDHFFSLILYFHKQQTITVNEDRETKLLCPCRRQAAVQDETVPFQ